MTWLVRYMRYYVAGEHEVDSLAEGISFAMYGIEENTCAPTAIVDPEGHTVVDDAGISDIYSREWDVVSIDDIVARIRGGLPGGLPE